MDNIRVQRMHLDDDYEKNTCNHPRDPDDLDANLLDYETEIKKTNMMNYVDLINYHIDWQYTFTKEELTILGKCAEKGRFLDSGQLFEIDVEDIVARLKHEWKDGVWFFRFNSCSPKISKASSGLAS